MTTLLLGWGVTAFGVAPLTAVDPAPIATRVIQEHIATQRLQAQLDATDLHALTLYRSDRTRAGDTAETLLARLGIDDHEAAQFLRRDPIAQQVLTGRAGKPVQVTIEQPSSGLGQLVQLTLRGPAARIDGAEDSPEVSRRFTRIVIKREGGRLVSGTEQVPLQVQQRTTTGTIESSLFSAADDAQIPDAVTTQLAEIFGSDIDFRRELRRGDQFTVLYETLVADGEPVNWGPATGRILAARFVNRGDTLEAYWFQEPGKRGGYFDANGRSKARVFLASPLAFSRISSGFSMRFHPILQTWRAHLGVDYAAPTGTSVRAVGDATVEFAGWQNGYGNVVQLRHGGDKLTVYAHLSRIQVKQGERVVQGQAVGAVGATGWATGPHLHFEFRQAGHQVDPLKVARSSETVALSPTARAQFMASQQAAAQQLAGAVGAA
ncbi:MAG: M23 family metallopeptidase, partial [Burkholderiales bacterium]